MFYGGLLAGAEGARQAGDAVATSHYEQQAALVWDAIMAGNAAALEYLQDEAGLTRVGYHRGTGAETTAELGRWEHARDWVIGSFHQHTSRSGDPQLHVHNLVLAKVVTERDGKWRKLDSRARQMYHIQRDVALRTRPPKRAEPLDLRARLRDWEQVARARDLGELAAIPVREWQYWTRNKLGILAGYLPAFNIASKSSSERLYIDLMAGDPVNLDKATHEEFDGSARLALSAQPSFTRLAFCEKPDKAALSQADLDQRFPGRPFRVYPGDCNETIDNVLADLVRWRWAPTFVFADQQAAEVHWTTLAKVAAFRRSRNRWKAEIWILMSPAEIARGVAGTNGEAFAARVDALCRRALWRR